MNDMKELTNRDVIKLMIILVEDLEQYIDYDSIIQKTEEEDAKDFVRLRQTIFDLNMLASNFRDEYRNAVVTEFTFEPFTIDFSKRMNNLEEVTWRCNFLINYAENLEKMLLLGGDDNSKLYRQTANYLKVLELYKKYEVIINPEVIGSIDISEQNQVFEAEDSNAITIPKWLELFHPDIAQELVEQDSEYTKNLLKNIVEITQNYQKSYPGRLTREKLNSIIYTAIMYTKK